MQTIKLDNSEWHYDETKPLGPSGGFGQVFLGLGTNGKVAVKRLHLDASQLAFRELSIGESLMNRDLLNVVPVYDIGQDANSNNYFVVMPVCEKSLQDEINNKGAMSVQETVGILQQILNGLNEVKDITHRDLKPSNILFLDGKWKIADFGIAKFVSDATSLKTLKESLTAPYAAPEQWNLQHSTSSTDIYALGCIAHCLLTGTPPFSGSSEDLKQKHLTQIPPIIDGIPSQMQNLLTFMLRKNPLTRMNGSRCLEVLAKIDSDNEKNTSRATSALITSISTISTERAKKEAETAQIQQARREREDLINDSLNSLKEIRARLFNRIKEHAVELLQENDRVDSAAQIKLGHAVFKFYTSESGDNFGLRRAEAEQRSFNGRPINPKQSPWDILVSTSLTLGQESPKNRSIGCNLVLCRPGHQGSFRWYEIGFQSGGMVSRLPVLVPFPINSITDIDLALSKVMHTSSVYYGPKPIDCEDEESFIERWIELIALAAIGKL